MTASNTKRPRSHRQALPATGPLPNGHTNRSTESCGPSVNSKSTVSIGIGHRFSPASASCLERVVVPRDREVERRRFAAGEFVCLDEKLHNVKSSRLGERLVSIVRSGARLPALISSPPNCHYPIRRTSP